MLFSGGAGHTSEFRGGFDLVMAFFFYVPNLLVVEAFLRARPGSASPRLRGAAACVLIGAAGFLILGTYFFTKLYWGPAILARVLS